MAPSKTPGAVRPVTRRCEKHWSPPGARRVVTTAALFVMPARKTRRVIPGRRGGVPQPARRDQVDRSGPDRFFLTMSRSAFSRHRAPDLSHSQLAERATAGARHFAAASLSSRARSRRYHKVHAIQYKGYLKSVEKRRGPGGVGTFVSLGFLDIIRSYATATHLGRASKRHAGCSVRPLQRARLG